MTACLRTGVVAGLAALAAVVPALGTSSIAVVGDPGVDNANEAAVAAMVAGWSPDHVVLLGDNYYAAAGGSGTGKYDITVGKYYCAFMAGVASGPHCAGGTAPTNRLWPIAGNHEYSDAGISNYLGYFALPGNERYYDLRTGPVHFFMLDSDEAMRSSSDMAAQRAWLQTALAASDAPFRVVVLHHPPWTSSVRGPYPAMRWPYREWGADLVLNGHDHFYERLEVDGLPYVVNGVGGQAVTAFPASAAVGSRTHYSGSNGAMRLTADATTLTAAFVSVDGVTRDALTITRALPAPAPPPAPSAAATEVARATARLTSRRVVRVSARQVIVPLRVALTGTSPRGAAVRAAVTLRRSGRAVGRGVATVRVGRGGTLPVRATVRVGLGPAVARALRDGQRVSVATAITVMPVGGGAHTSRATGTAVVR